MSKPLSRRSFMKTTAAGIGMSLAGSVLVNAKPALLGGKPVRTTPFPAWPVFDAAEEQALLRALRSGQWFRGSGQHVSEFESAYADLMGARHCIGTSSGTNALIASLNALGVGAGDEVILPPYTFIACVNAVLALGAVPVFVDTDLNTFQIDAGKIESAITPVTAAIMPVHLGGNAADLDTILTVARKHNIPVVEDACQAHLGEWRGRKLGTWGSVGCFSFQASKNLTAGEGGAMVTGDEKLADRCYAAAHNSRPRKVTGPNANIMRGANLRMSEFHAALLLAQMKRLPQQAKLRDENAAYLTGMLQQIPGISPARRYEGCTRTGHHLYMFRYDPKRFADLPRSRFLSALAAEGIRASSGYTPLNKEPFIAETLSSRGYRRVVSDQRRKEWAERNQCPTNDRLCQEAVWFSQNMLLADRQSMEQIAEAIKRIQTHSAELASR